MIYILNCLIHNV